MIAQIIIIVIAAAAAVCQGTVIVPKEKVIPYCKNCRFFVPTEAKCTRFKHIDVVSGDIISDKHSAKYAREKAFMCSIEGRFFEPTEASIIEAEQILRYIQQKDFTSLEVVLQLYSIYNNLHTVFTTNLH